MEELLIKLEILAKIRQAISQTYNDVKECKVYHECMEFINDFEKKVLDEMISL